jgi:hypothetical protein
LLKSVAGLFELEYWRRLYFVLLAAEAAEVEFAWREAARAVASFFLKLYT